MTTRLFSLDAYRFAVPDLDKAIGKWSRAGTYGDKSAKGDGLVFDVSALSSFIANAQARNDEIAIDQDHKTAFVESTGQPAPSLGFFHAMALFKNGELVKHWARDGQPPPDGTGYSDEKRDGLYFRLGRITPLGYDPKEGLANYAGLSLLFSEDGRAEDDTPIGPALICVAATSSPFLAGTPIQFHRTSHALTGANNGVIKMATLHDYRTGDSIRDASPAEESASEAAAKRDGGAGVIQVDGRACYVMGKGAGAKRAFSTGGTMDPEMMKKFGIETDDDDAKKAEKMAAFWAGHDAMAAKCAKMDAAPEPDKEKEAAMTAMSAALAGATTKIAALEAAETARAKVETDAREKTFSALADDAVAGGYPVDARDALITMARSNMPAAEKIAAPFASKAHALSQSATRGNLPRTLATVGDDVKEGKGTVAFGQKLATAIKMHREKHPGMDYITAAEQVGKANPELVASYHNGGAR